MNFLRQLIDLRCITCKDIAIGTGYGYHSVQKTIKGHRRHRHVRKAIATFLDIDPDKTWGGESESYLSELVAVEVISVADQRAKVEREKILNKFNGILNTKDKAVND